MVNIEKSTELLKYLRDRSAIDSSEEPEVRNLRGGVSNRTVLVKRSNGDAWVLKQGLSKLRVKADWFCSPERVHREAAGLTLLSKLTPPGTVPSLVFEDRENLLFAMEAVPDPHENWKELLLEGKLARDHILQFAQLLATIHRRAVEECDCLQSEFGDLSFFEALRLEPYYAYTAEQVPVALNFYERLLKETRSHRVTLVHGDYSPKNILVYQEKLILLDHEVIHFGDPAFDLGFSLTHLLSKANHLKSYRASFSEAADSFFRIYWSKVGSEQWTEGIEARAVRHTLGCLLARVAGRSPLEYFTDSDRRRQKETVIGMLDSPPETVEELVRVFTEDLLKYA